MLALAMVTMAQQNPAIYDAYEAHKRAWSMLGVDDTDEFLHPAAPQQGQPDPMQAIQAKAQADLEIQKMKLAGAQQENERKAATEAVDTDREKQQSQIDATLQQQKQASDERIAAVREQTERVRLAAEEQRAHLDRSADLYKHGSDLQDRAASRTMTTPMTGGQI